MVLIRNVSFTLSGLFSCEVTADAPLYSTATAYAHMQVVGEYLLPSWAFEYLGISVSDGNSGPSDNDKQILSH